MNPSYLITRPLKIISWQRRFGIEPRSRGLEPPMLTVTPHRLEEGEGFEPSELLHPLVFKTSAINRTLPTFHIGKSLYDNQIFQPTLYTLPNLVAAYCHPPGGDDAESLSIGFRIILSYRLHL